MMNTNRLLRSPRPDIDRFLAHLRGSAHSPYVPLIEYIVDDVVMQPIVAELLGRTWVDRGPDRASERAYLDNVIEFWYRMGYDIVRYEDAYPLPQRKKLIADTAPGSTKGRAWPDEHGGMITSWEEFEQYPWPEPEEFDFFAFEYLDRHLPEGMGLVCSHGGGVFEHLSWIMSLEGLATALYDVPDLVRAVADRLGHLMTAFYRHLLTLERLAVVFPGDDMGYRSATMISPAVLREVTLPWHTRFAAMTHERGLPYFLHSCGNLTGIMTDLVDGVGIDAKHSFEDAIVPVQDFQRQWGDRIAVLGGLDINILAGGTTDDVRRHTRFLLHTCGARGRYALGSGNSVPSYVPVINYLTMLDERAAYLDEKGVT